MTAIAPHSKMVYVILPVHNRRAITVDFVEHLQKQTYPQIKLVLVDDGSKDGTAEAVTSLLPDTAVVRGDGNLWWAGGLQAGINWLKENAVALDSVVVMINDDTRIPEDFVETGVSLLSNSEKTLFCAQAFSLQTGELVDAGVHYDWLRFKIMTPKNESEINCTSTRGLFLKFSDVLKIGDFKPNILPHYTSDYEYTIRAWRKGFRLRSPAELKLFMNVETTGTQYIDSLGVRAYLKSAFSIRAPHNPWTAFKYISLAVPVFYKPFAYLKLVLYFGKCLFAALKNGI